VIKGSKIYFGSSKVNVISKHIIIYAFGVC
jgi:hypothetical protein